MADMNDQQKTPSRRQPILTALTVVAAVLVGQAVGQLSESWVAGTAAGLAIAVIGVIIAAVAAGRTAAR